MSRSASPLRYPGGKAKLLPFIGSVLKANNLDKCAYAEPYAGGAGLALSLLFEGFVNRIHINDVDRGVWAFWHSVLHETDALISLIEQTKIDVPRWRRAHHAHREQNDVDPLKLGFATFFLNRTNRSGVIKGGGVIGGLEQSGTYKIDCRYNRQDLIQRIKRVAKYRSQISLSKLDALTFMERRDARHELFFYIDPPYFAKGPGLYTNHYKEDDHAEVADHILQLRNPWIVTYDNVPNIEQLYRSRRQFQLSLSYSLNEKRIGTELLVASKGLKVRSSIMSSKQVAGF